MSKYKRQSENKSFNEMLDTILEGILEHTTSINSWKFSVITAAATSFILH